MKRKASLKDVKWKYLTFIVIIFVLFACNQDEDLDRPDKQTIAVPIEISSLTMNTTKSIDTQPHSVNRVLLMPFKKINESIATNDDSNFSLDQAAVKQVEFNYSPAYLTMLNLTQGSTYKILVIGYNSNDYDINNPDLDEKFDLSYFDPYILDVLYYHAISAADISDFFTATGMSFNGDAETGEYFKPEDIKTLKANLIRSVSGLSLEINDIPDYVTSVTLVAEKLVRSVFLPDLEFLEVVYEYENDTLKTFSTQIPDAGHVSFDHYLLPTFDVNSTRFYLDIRLGSITERYLVIVNDVAGVSSGNSISFYPNQVVKIVGNYSSINLGFTLSYSINLDDDSWDGI